MSGIVTGDRLSHSPDLFETLDPQAPPKVIENLDRMSEDFAEVVLSFAFADVVSRPVIDLKTR